MKTARLIIGSELGDDFISKIWRRINVRQKYECWEWDKPAGAARYPVMRHSKWKTNLKSHRVVYALMHGKTDAEMVVCHACDNPLCCNPYHLVLGTQQENVLDMFRKRRANMNYGEAHHLTKLTESQVRAIHDDPRPSREICKEYGIGRTQVKRIKREEQWQNLWGTAKYARS
jgi:hypothetical protein